MLRLNILHRHAIRHPGRVILVGLLVTAASAPGIARLELRTDGHALVPAGAPSVRYDRSVRAEFGIEDPIVVLVRPRHPDGIYNPHTMHLVRELTDDLKRIPGVRASSLFSLATESSDHFIPGKLDFRPLLDPIPETPAALAELRDDLRAMRLYRGTLVSYDGKATAVMVGAPSSADRTDLYAAVQRVVAARVTPSLEEVQVLGAPVAETLLGTHILADLGVPDRVLGSRALGVRRGEMAGAPTGHSLRTSIGRTVGLIPLVLLAMTLVFLACFRRPAAAALPLFEVGACLVFVFGLMGWTHQPVYLTTAVMAVILCAMGVTDEIHVFSHFTRRRRERPDETAENAVRGCMDEMCVPITKTAVTTALGFLSFLFSPLAPVRAFGLFTGAGMLFCMVWSLTVIPALLLLLERRRGAAPTGGRSRPVALVPHAASGAAAGALRQLAHGVMRWRYAVLACAVLGAAATPLGIRRIVVQDSWISGFARDSQFYRATQEFNGQFFGTHQLLVTVRTDSTLLRGSVPVADVQHHAIRLPGNLAANPGWLVGSWLEIRRPGTTGPGNPRPGEPLRWNAWPSWIATAARSGDRILVTMPLYSGSPLFTLMPDSGATLDYEIRSQRLMAPDVLREIGRFEEFVRRQDRYTVGGVLGPSDFVATTQYIMKRRDEAWRRVPDDPDAVRVLWSQYERIRGRERLRQLVNTNFSQGLVTVYMKNANFVDTAHLMQAIRDYEHEHLSPLGIRLDFAGDVAVSQTFIDAIVSTQVRSLLSSILGVLLITTALGRSLRWGFYCIIPCALAVAASFAVMGWIQMPLGVATSMFAAMILGIGVDYAIHLLERYRTALGQGLPREPAIAEAMAQTGPALLVDALAVALGFGVLTFSQVPANARLGLLVVVCIATALLLTLLLMPALLRLSPTPRPLQFREPL